QEDAALRVVRGVVGVDRARGRLELEARVTIAYDDPDLLRALEHLAVPPVVDRSAGAPELDVGVLLDLAGPRRADLHGCVVALGAVEVGGEADVLEEPLPLDLALHVDRGPPLDEHLSGDVGARAGLRALEARADLSHGALAEGQHEEAVARNLDRPAEDPDV